MHRHVEPCRTDANEKERALLLHNVSWVSPFIRGQEGASAQTWTTLKQHMSQTSNPVLAVRLEQVRGQWRIYIASVEIDRITICAKKNTGLVFKIQAKNVSSCTSFVNDLLWKSLVKVSSLLVPEHFFQEDFDALENARGGQEIRVISTFSGVLSREEIRQYVEQVSDITVC